MKNKFAQCSLYLLMSLFLFFIFQLFFLTRAFSKAEVSPNVGLGYSFVSLGIYLVGSLLAILLGSLGVLAIRRNPSLDGQEWSLAGIVMGTLVLAPILVGFYVVLYVGVGFK